MAHDLKFCPHCLMPTTATSGRTEMPMSGVRREVQAECVRDAQPSGAHGIPSAKGESWPLVYCDVREFEGEMIVDIARHNHITNRPSTTENVTFTLNQFYGVAAFVAARIEGDKELARRAPPKNEGNMQDVHNADEQQPPKD